jgi:hypothetical protein
LSYYAAPGEHVTCQKPMSVDARPSRQAI